MSSIADRIRAKNDLATETVEVPEWGETLEVRSPSARTRMALVDDARDENGETVPSKLAISFIIATCYDPATGELAFTGDDADMLNDKAFSAIDRLASAAARVSGLDEAAVDSGKDDSSSTVNGDTSSG